MAAEDATVRRWLELLWPGEVPPARGPKPVLSLLAIVRCGIESADRDGLAALSMRGVADKLGFSVMSLYRHVPGKEELVEVMLDTALGEPPVLDRVMNWRSQISQWAKASSEILHRHPWLLEAVVSRAPIGPNRLRWFDAGLQALSSLGLSGREKVSLVLLVDSYVRGAAQVSVGVTRATARMGTTQAEWSATYARILHQVATPARYPALAAIVSEGAFDQPSAIDDFDFGLLRLLDGIEAHTPRRRRPVRNQSGRK
jgi:AcrR family transcriptional regulator